ncbi:scarecrow-like protein 21 [Physcomitrium patens]|uniref:Uncharacterized protein n=1 Tax=Physcomitrium patens TaxID=3218 RepID=A0A2K1JW18_PHYPA|nr:DELLA protein RGL1-like [Physcomitrium patens]XP_024388063.1 DELLA protein RGL1-like [Physcomitrium patens]XP_024388065.1 DELLA protein RGL1-like [Physcomitrium patens]XP_024388066.1 DELLA protein RGL1-like [Physcomitrium patens]XP_024388067.1 DELLA protein RGL1-like [Physcomitrium patens]PNR45725.1 hypothetical protein PHYPA_015496 [Physcomitrium patens]|eukprot:XP_024388062.1 DELLA protein RGL1-like [Physcomitrella patens]
MADGDLTSIFSQRTQPISDPWGVAVPQQQLLHYRQFPQLLQDLDNARRDYSSCQPPQSPCDIQEQNSNLSNRMLQAKVGSYNPGFSSLRPSALPSQNHLNFPAVSPQIVQYSLPQALVGTKGDYQGSDFHLQGSQPTIAAGSNAFTEVISRISPVGRDTLAGADQQHQALFVESGKNIEHPQLSTWPSITTLYKVDERATELQTDTLGELRSGPEYVADLYTGGLLLCGQVYNEGRCMEVQSNSLSSGAESMPILQQNFLGDGGIIKVLDTASNRQSQPTSATGLQIVQLLLSCAEAISNQQIDVAYVFLRRLNGMLGHCTTTMQRLGTVLVDALYARITNSIDSGRYKGLEKDGDVAILDMLHSFSVIYDYTPFIKFPNLTLNQIILDAVEGAQHVHVIDLNTGWRGMQWPAVIQSLALRPGGPPHLRITSIGKLDDLEQSREKLQDFARNLQVPFEFCPLVVDMKSFDVRLLDLRDWEVLCINSANQFHQLLTWGDERFHRFLCDLRSLNPRVVAFSENDADHNSPKFLNRFFECLRYYSAVYDALDAALPSGSPALQQVEHLFTGQKIRNIVACEGEDRITRHEPMKNWSRRMELAGFRPMPLSTRAISQARALLEIYFSLSGYNLRTENGILVLGWDNTPLVGVSAWRA